MHILNSFGWVWRQNGVELCVDIDGRKIRVFIPIARVQMTFDRELAAVGWMPPPRVGAPTVAGIFDSIGKGVSSLGKAATRAVSRGASSLARTASKWGSAALKGVTSNPVYNLVATGVSFVPGLGQGVSAGMAAAAALGRGESIRDIGLAAAKNALPGGPAAAAAFDIAVGVAKGQRLDSIALQTARNQLPGGPLAKAAFDAGVQAIKSRSLSHVPGAAVRTAARQLPGQFGNFTRALPAARGFAGLARSFAPPQAAPAARGFAGLARSFAPQAPRPDRVFGRFGTMFAPARAAQAARRATPFNAARAAFSRFF